MIHLTEKAAQAIEKLRKERADESQMMRLRVETGGCSGFEYGMLFDEPKEGDEYVEEHGIKVVIDPKSLEKLKGCRVDYDDGLTGKGFEIQNPNAESTCGCGRSFN